MQARNFSLEPNPDQPSRRWLNTRTGAILTVTEANWNTREPGGSLLETTKDTFVSVIDERGRGLYMDEWLHFGPPTLELVHQLAVQAMVTHARRVGSSVVASTS